MWCVLLLLCWDLCIMYIKHVVGNPHVIIREYLMKCVDTHLVVHSEKDTVQYSAVQCSTVQCSTVQCSTVQCSAVQCSAVQCSAVQCSTVQCNAVQCSTVQCSADAHCEHCEVTSLNLTLHVIIILSGNCLIYFKMSTDN